MSRMMLFHLLAFLVLCSAITTHAHQLKLDGRTAEASSSSEGFPPAGALQGERFSAEPKQSWKGASGANRWWWQVRFDQPQRIGAILQIVGDHPFVFRNAPRAYGWEGSEDGRRWFDLPGTRLARENRLFRIHRLASSRSFRFIRLSISACEGDFPALREVEFYSEPNDSIIFPDWVVAVNTTHDPKLPNQGQEFIPLAQSAPGWERLQAQQVWLESFDSSFVTAEPRPVCAFLSGTFKDWCEVDRGLWRGTAQVLQGRHLPMWASCGGAQGLAILAETGVDKPWDCPHCRDPKAPKTPIYSHLGHTGKKACGDYSDCIFERGPRLVRPAARDPVFEGLGEEFTVMESHCGQIEWAPKGWSLIAGPGEGTQTRIQCLRMDDRFIYAAQFHIEMDGTPAVSRRIIGNFLSLAKKWRGAHPGLEKRP